VELGYSALLAFVIMGVATDERAPAGVAPFALGATVFAGALVTGPLTGGSFNPARSLGPALAGGRWTAHWLYWVAPISGMVVAMHVYERLRPANAPAVPRAVPLGVEGPIGRPWVVLGEIGVQRTTCLALSDGSAGPCGAPSRRRTVVGTATVSQMA
jgi:hypothetical protein